MANLSNINNKFLFTDGDFLKIGNLAPINNISGTESGISITNSNVASITLDNTAASGKKYVMYSDDGGKLNFYDADASSGRLVIDSSGNSTFGGDVFAPRFDVGTTSTSIIQEINRMKFTNAISNDAGGFDFFTRNSSSTYINALTILGSGNVGIGTDSPTSKLHIVDDEVVLGTVITDYRDLAIQVATSQETANSGTGISFDHGALGAAIASARVVNTTWGTDLRFYTHPDATTNQRNVTERMRIDSSGNITQTASGNPTLTISGSDGAYTGILKINAAGGGGSKIEALGGTNSLAIETNGSEKMRITSAGDTSIYGRVGIGNGTGAGYSSFQLYIRGNSNSSDVIMQIDNTKYGSTDNAGESKLKFGWNNHSAAAISAYKDGTVNRTGFKFYTEVGYNVPVEKMRITSSGTIQIKNGTVNGGEIKLTGADNDLTLNGTRSQIVFQINGTSKLGMDPNQFYPETDNTYNLGTSGLRFSTVYAANGVSTSDETLKENIKECDLGIDFINSLKPKSYNLKDLKEDNDAYGKKRYGLIAQDILETELKDSVFGKKDGEYGLSYNDLIAPMIKAIQELKADNDSLKARIETLENN